MFVRQIGWHSWEWEENFCLVLVSCQCNVDSMDQHTASGTSFPGLYLLFVCSVVWCKSSITTHVPAFNGHFLRSCAFDAAPVFNQLNTGSHLKRIPKITLLSSYYIPAASAQPLLKPALALWSAWLIIPFVSRLFWWSKRIISQCTPKACMEEWSLLKVCEPWRRASQVSMGHVNE